LPYTGTSILNNPVSSQGAVIIRSGRNLIQGINGCTPFDYPESVSLTDKGGIADVASFRFV
jgi:hypothetical protein